MMRQQIHFTKNKDYISYTYSPQSIGILCHAIEKNEYGKEAGLGQLDGYPGITRRTVRRHLKKLVKAASIDKTP